MTKHLADINDSRPRLGLLLGDCTGIGPELIAKVLSEGRVREVARIVVVGDVRVLERGMRDANVSLRYTVVPDVGAIDWRSATVPVIDLGNIDPDRFKQGEVSAESGRLIGDTLAYAIEMSKRGEIDAITFAPLNKRAMYDGGWKFPDEHKMFAHLLEHKGYFSEMNVLDGQWMSRVTGHTSLRQAVAEVTPERIRDAIELADRLMRRVGIAKPRIAVCALNPHAGENGLFGTDEIDYIRPTVEETAASGIDCRGPFPADTIYIKAFAGDFDGVVAMYHDQGQIATKLRGFQRGVTVTGGLETVFTTPSHGTAFDIVGKGIANPGATETAIRLAASLATGRIALAPRPAEANVCDERFIGTSNEN
jgi:4-hydroxythreonine-4-phosphate dehydrogenase